MTRSNFSYWTQSRELDLAMGIQSNPLPRGSDKRAVSILWNLGIGTSLGKKGDASQPHVGGAFLYEALGHSIFLILARLCRRMFELPQCLQQLASIPYKRLRISTPVRSFKTGFMISPLIRIRISLSVNFPWFLLLNTNWCCNEPI